MRQFNIRFFAYLVLGSLAVVVAAYLLHGFNVGRSAEGKVLEAEDAYRGKDLRSAISRYDEYLGQFPQDDERLKRRAIIAAELTKDGSMQPRRDVPRAYKLLEEALHRDKLRDDYELRRKLVDVLVLMGEFPEAREHIQKLADSGKTDKDLQFLDARCATHLHLYDEAVAGLSKLVGYDSATKKFDAKRATAPDNIDAYRLLAIILREHKESLSQADAVVDRMVAANPKSPLALERRYEYLMQFNKEGTRAEYTARIEQAKKDLRDALKIDPNNLEVLWRSAEESIREKDYPAARKHLEHALSVDPDNDRIYLQMAMVLSAEKKMPEAIDCIKRGIQKLPKSLNLVWTLHGFELQVGNIPAARDAIEQMVHLQSAPEIVALAKAHVLLVERKWAEAASQLEAVLPQLKGNPNLSRDAYLSSAHCYAMLHQPDRQLEAYARILQQEPDSVDALREKAEALALLGRYEEAFDVYQKNLERMLAAEGVVGDKSPLHAYYQVVEALSRRDPQNVLYADLKQRTRLRLEQQGGISELEGVLVKVDALLRDKRYDQAAALLDKEIARRPKELGLRAAALSIVVERQGVAAGLAQVAKLEKELGDSVEIRRLRGELLLRQGGPDAKQNIAALEKGIDKFSRQGQSDLWTLLGQWYLRLAPSNRDDLRRCWQRALDLNPNNAPLMERLFDVARESGDDDAMLKARDDFERAFGRDSSQWKYAEASRLVAQVRKRPGDVADLDNASKLVAQAAEQRPDWYMLVRLQGDIHDLKGEKEDALRDYQHSLELGPSNPLVVQRVVLMQIERRKFKEARSALQHLNGALAMPKAEVLIAVGLGEPEVALAALSRAVPDNAKEPEDLLWKGQLLLRLGKKDNAEGVFREAVERGPAMPQTWAALVECLARDGKPQEAASVIRTAENQLSDDDAPMVLAFCHRMLGNNDQAERYFLRALNVRPNQMAIVREIAAFYLGSQQVPKAVPYLRRIIDAAPQLRREDMQHVVWARRELARINARTDLYPQFRAAIQMVKENAGSGPSSPDDLLLIAQLLSFRPDNASLRQSLQLVEQLRAQYPLNADVRLMLAQLYARVNQWDKCRAEVIELVANNPEDARLPTLLADALLKRGEPELAVPWVSKLALLQPKSPATLELSVRLAARRNRPEEAVALVDAALPKQLTLENAQAFSAAALLLENSGLYPAAEKRFRDLAQLGPQGKMVLGGYLARRGRLEETIAVLNSEVSSATIIEVCQSGTTALRAAMQSNLPVSPRQREQLLSWFEQAHRLAPNSVAVMYEEAGLLNLLGRTEDSIRLYRQLVDNPRVSPVVRAQAANNLAFILALSGRDLEEAQKLVETSIEWLGPLKEMLDTRAMVNIARGNPQDAVRDLTDATEFGAEPDLFFHLALAQQKANERAEAGQSLRRARDEGFRKEKILSPAERREYDELAVELKINEDPPKSRH